MMWGRSPVRALVVLVALILVAAGCGIPTDQTAGELAEGEIPASLLPGAAPNTVSDAIAEGEGVPVFMVGPDNRRLVEVQRAVESSPAGVLQALLEGPTFPEIQQGITSKMLRSTAVVDFDVDQLFQIARVTLAPNSLDTDPQTQMLIFGQFVFTLTALEGIESVIFAEENDEGGREAIPVQTAVGPRDRGVEVRRADYASIDPGFNIIAFPTDSEVPAPAPTVQPAGTNELVSVPIWVLDAQDRLVPVDRQVAQSAAALLQTLFDGLTTTELEAGLRSAIPFDALARNVEVIAVESVAEGAFDLAVVDLTSETLPPAGSGVERTLAVAQMVYTLTGLIDVDHVVFTIDGQPTTMPTQQGRSSPFDPDEPSGLSRSDYDTFAGEAPLTLQTDDASAEDSPDDPAAEAETSSESEPGADPEAAATATPEAAEPTPTPVPEPTPTPGG